jgi:hypothetical protein
MAMSTDRPFCAPRLPLFPPQPPTSGERLFEFVRDSDHAPIVCELWFHGETYGWEAQFFSRGTFVFSRSGFPIRALAVTWAWEERKAFERIS